MWPRSLIFLAAAVAFVGCSTVHQKYVEPGATGIYVAPVAAAGGYVVDSAFRDRYNALISIYGHKKLDDGAPVFLPPPAKDDGLSPMGGGKWFMTKEAMETMVVLSDLKRRGAAP